MDNMRKEHEAFEVGERVRVHWHFNQHKYSVSVKTDKGWRVVRDKDTGDQLLFGKVVLNDVAFKVSKAGAKKAFNTGQRSVHAWIEGNIIAYMRQDARPTSGLLGMPVFYSHNLYASPVFKAKKDGIWHDIHECRLVSAGVKEDSKPEVLAW